MKTVLFFLLNKTKQKPQLNNYEAKEKAAHLGQKTGEVRKDHYELTVCGPLEGRLAADLNGEV